MELWHLETFLTVVKTESLTVAAERLHLSQPSVSTHIRALEQELGLPLFHRTGRGMKLTSAGDELSALARDVLARARALESRAAELRGDATGTLRLGGIYSGADLAIATNVGRLRQQFPELRVELCVQASGQNAQDLLAYKLDIALLEGEFNDSRLCLRRIATSRVGIIGPYAWKDRMVAGDWAQLAEFPWLFQSDSCSYFRLLCELGKSHNLTFQAAYRSDMFGTIWELVAEGMALSIVDLDSVQAHVDAKKVFIWGDFEHVMPVSVACLHSRRTEPAIAHYWHGPSAHPLMSGGSRALRIAKGND